MSYEDTYLYLDLTKDVLKKKDIIKVIKYFIDEKNKINLKGHYSILIFQEEGNPIFITDKKDSEIITKAIGENWNSRTKEVSFFENGLFYIFSYIAETVRKKSKYNRVIVITDTPSDLNDEYQEAVFNLVEKIKHFPTFIDIIRVAGKGERFFKDDVKMNILASDTKGGNFTVQGKKEFQDIIEKLIRSKQLVTTFADRPDQIKISSDDYMFYSRLAKQLVKHNTMEKIECFFCREEICPVCTNLDDVPLICEDCNSGFHSCCVTNYTMTHNIGIPHIFRCPKCDILLQIDEDEIIGVAGEEDITSVKEYIGMEKYSDSYEDYDDGPVIVEENEFSPDELEKIQPPEISASQEFAPPPKDPSGEEVNRIRVGGFFGKMYSVRKDANGNIIYERQAKTQPIQYQAEVTTDLGTSPSVKPSPFQNRGKSRINICTVCGTPVPTENVTKCTKCGSPL